MQPDHTRPYALVDIVVFHLPDVRLHFVLGSHQPYLLKSTPRGTGRIPAQDLLPGVLLAAFNGGFKVEHGHFGAFADGLAVVPPQDGLATVAINADGQVRIGAWNQDLFPSPDIIAYRQNGLLIVLQGQVTPHVDDPKIWGRTLSGSSFTWRSALVQNQAT